MRHRHSLLPASLLVATAGCAPTAERSPAVDYNAVADTVRAGMVSYADALNAIDSVRWLGHYVASGDFRLVSDGHTYSYSDMQKVFGDTRRAFQALGVTWDTVIVTPLSQDAALVYAPFRRADTDKAGALVRVRGVATWIWVRRDGAWRMLYGHGDHYPDTSASK